MVGPEDLSDEEGEMFPGGDGKTTLAVIGEVSAYLKTISLQIEAILCFFFVLLY